MARALVVVRFALVMSALLLTAVVVAVAAPAATDPMAQGLHAFQNGHFAQAVRHWQRAVDLSIERRQPAAQSRALTYLAQAYQALGHYKKAQATLHQALA